MTNWFRHLLGDAGDENEELKDDGKPMDQLVNEAVDALNKARNRGILEGDQEALEDFRQELKDQNKPKPPKP